MNKAYTMEPTVEEIKATEIEMDSIYFQIKSIDERIQKDQQEIDRLTVKTRTALNQLKAL